MVRPYARHQRRVGSFYPDRRPRVDAGAHDGGEDTGVGEQDDALLGLEPHVGQTDAEDPARVRTVEGAAANGDLVTDLEGPVEQQDQAGDDVGQGLLGGDTEHDPGDGTGDQQPLDRDLQQEQQRHGGRGVAGQRQQQGDDRGVGVPEAGPAARGHLAGDAADGQHRQRHERDAARDRDAAVGERGPGQVAEDADHRGRDQRQQAEGQAALEVRPQAAGQQVVDGARSGLERSENSDSDLLKGIALSPTLGRGS